MPLFKYEEIMSLNERELQVYSYVAGHAAQVEKMSIRQIASAVGVSTTTVLRFCAKVGCEGFQELKYKLKRCREKVSTDSWHIPQDSAQVLQFLQKLDKSTEMQGRLQQAAEKCSKAKHIICTGMGSSAILAESGARSLASLCLPAVSINDPFYPKPVHDMTGDVLIALSVSGETQEMICQVSNYRSVGATTISITNVSACRLAAFSDININYYVPLFYAPASMGPQNLTTQLPVIYLLEILARRAAALATEIRNS